MTEKPKETPKEELECPKKYVYDTGVIFECKENSRVEILGEDVVDLLNELATKCSKLEKENEQLKKALDDLKVYDDEDFRETEYINSIYKEEGFNGVIDYAKDKLQYYGVVKEVEKGLWVMVTGGWSDNEFFIHCLNHLLSNFGRKHYRAYEIGGAFYYTEEPHKDVEIHIEKR